MKSNYSREERQKIVEEYIQSGKSQTVEIEIPGNSNAVMIREILAAMDALSNSVFFFCNKSHKPGP